MAETEALFNALILVLDEATSNLDSENERLIKAAVARLIMIDYGRVVASGHHADLVAADGPYAQLIAAQRRHA